MTSKTPTFIAVTHKRAGFEQGIRAKSCQDARKYAVYLKRKKKQTHYLTYLRHILILISYLQPKRRLQSLFARSFFSLHFT